ncbi:MAG: transcriptional repressor LexA [Myxococcota bacterium]
MSKARKKLTQRQQDVFEFIVHTIAQEGYPPTLREIGNHMDIPSTNAINDHLRAIERKGYLKRNRHRARALCPLFPEHDDSITHLRQLLEPDERRVPILGKVAAGQPIPAHEQHEQSLRIDPHMLKDTPIEEVFAVEVQGDSMIEDGILEGDFLIVRKQEHAENGTIVVALIDHEVTVKRFYQEGAKIRLQPANARMRPMVYNAKSQKDLRLLGIAIGLTRAL